MRILGAAFVRRFEGRLLNIHPSLLPAFPGLHTHRRALEAGCDGVVSSGLEAPKLREFIDQRLIVVTPGIRPVENKPVDDQKRTVDVAQAFANGADYIVVGRPIRDAADPRAAAEAIQQTIAGIFGGGAAK
jgi:orotidine-5'-phosphate decarboxylase